MTRPLLFAIALPLLASCTLLFAEAPENGSAKDCNSLSALRETFTSGSLSSAWVVWEQTLSGSYIHGDGAGILVVEGGSSGSRELRSRFEHNVLDSTLSVAIDEVHASMNTYVELRALGPAKGAPAASIRHINGILQAQYRGLTLAEIEYKPMQHRVWQLRVTEDTLYFEVGPDSEHVKLVEQTSSFETFPRGHLYAAIGVSGVGADGQVRIGGINTTDKASPLCKVSTLADSFDENRLDALWSNRDVTDECEYTTVGKNLEIVSQGTSCSMRSGQGYDLRDGQIDLHFDEVPQVPEGGTMYFGVSTGNDENRVIMRSDGDTLTPEVCVKGNCTPRPGKAVGAETLWRLSVEEELLLWSVREPGGTEQLVDKFPSPFPLEAMRVILGASGRQDSTYVVRFGGVNAP